MMTGIRWFNIYLLLFFLALVPGCSTTGGKKQGKDASTLRLHLEVHADGTPHNTSVPIYRERPVLVNINREPFLTEADIDSAAVVNVVGGFAIQVQFNRHGTLILDNVSSVNRGRRVVIQSQFTEPRWLAAPVMTRRLTDGVLVFTPDATQEETDRIVRGLNNLVAALKKRAKF